MAFSKVIFNGTTLMDVTSDTVDAANLLTGYTATKNDGTQVTGTYQGGGGGEPQTEPTIENGVIFMDYDGTIIEEWDVSEVSGKSDLPSNPTHTGLTAQGWNWSLSDIKTYMGTYPRILTVGQLYTTVSGASEIDVTLREDTLHPYLGIAPNGTVTVDWGDGSAADTLTGTSLTTLKWANHAYSQPGDYTIKLTASSGTFNFYANGEYSGVLSNTSSYSINRLYNSTIQAIRIGPSAGIGNYAFFYVSLMKYMTIPNTVSSFGTYAFYGCSMLESLVVPNGITTVSNNAFRFCYKLRGLSLPNSLTSIGQYAFYNCLNMRELSLSNSITSLGNYCFYGCYKFETMIFPPSVTSLPTYCMQNAYGMLHAVLPSSLTTIGQYAFYVCIVLADIIIPSNVTTISANSFNRCNSLSSIRFEKSTPPTVSATTAWTDVPTAAKIYVPVGSLSSYLSASNYPSKTSFTYIGYGTYAQGATLPSQDSSSTYSLTWYATKNDAINQVSAITQGNGNEVYCRYV